jgi:hypothetical protein
MFRWWKIFRRELSTLKGISHLFHELNDKENISQHKYLLLQKYLPSIQDIWLLFLYIKAPQPKLRTHRSLEGLLCNPVMKMMFFLLSHFNGAPVEWNWQGKTEVLGEKPVPVPLYPPQIPNGPNRDRNRASAVRGLRLTSWATARPIWLLYF